MNNAREYALQVLENQIKLVEDAYNRGYADALKTIKSEPIYETYDTFVDLGLESGTLWTRIANSSSSNRWGELGYYDSLKYGLPTKEQLYEMLGRCRIKQNQELLGPSGEHVSYREIIHCKQRIWIQSEVVEDEALAFDFKNVENPRFERVFVGEHLMFLRVKNKE